MGTEIKLSRREMEVARLVAEGLTNREIASRLFLSERTVDGHLEHVREKLNFNSRAQVAAWVVRQDGAPQTSSAVVARRSFRWAAIPRRWLWIAAVVLVILEATVVLMSDAPPGPKITTVAGSRLPAGFERVGGFSGEVGSATSVLLSLPTDVAAARDGTIYIADSRNRRIRQLLNGTIRTVAGGGAEAPATGRIGTSVDIQDAGNVAVDTSGQPYFLTNDGGVLELWRIEEGDSLTLVVRVASSEPDWNTWWPPAVGGLAIGPRHTIYISDRSGNRVYRFTPGAAQPVPVAGTGKAGFSGDYGPATGAQLWGPGGLALDARGNLYIADSVNNRIRKVDTNGFISTVAGGGGKYYGDTGDGGPAVRARLNSPYGVAVARDGTIYVADTGNNRVRMVTPAGIILALAGSGVAGFGGDGGDAGQAQLAVPEGITLDGRGDLLIADTLNLRIREVSGLNA